MSDKPGQQCPSRHPQRSHRQCERPAGHKQYLQDEDPFQHRTVRAAGEVLQWWDPVPVARTAAAWLTVASINDLWRADQNKGCCSSCCGRCYALLILIVDGTLDDLVRPFARNHLWWVDGRVDPEFLQRAWRMNSCHDDPASDLIDMHATPTIPAS